MEDRYMLCPYCKQTFITTEDDLWGLETFECPHCHGINAGCAEVDNLGVLIGVSLVDYKLRERCCKK